MQRYENLSGSSGVSAFEIGDGWIIVEFAGDESATVRCYRYTEASAGAQAIREMQQLARGGRGLATFIARHRPPSENDRR
jgi:hypothetical protein